MLEKQPPSDLCGRSRALRTAGQLRPPTCVKPALAPALRARRRRRCAGARISTTAVQDDRREHCLLPTHTQHRGRCRPLLPYRGRSPCTLHVVCDARGVRVT